MTTLFNFEDMEFPGYRNLKEWYEQGKKGRLPIFELGVLGNGFLSCFTNNSPEIIFVPSLIGNGTIRSKLFKFDVEKESQEDYYAFTQRIIDYCNMVFKVEMNCSGEHYWEEYLYEK